MSDKQEMPDIYIDPETKRSGMILGCVDPFQACQVKYVPNAKYQALVDKHKRDLKAIKNEVNNLIGQYWDLGYQEGSTGVCKSDEANEVLHKINKLFEDKL